MRWRGLGRAPIHEERRKWPSLSPNLRRWLERIEITLSILTRSTWARVPRYRCGVGRSRRIAWSTVALRWRYCWLCLSLRNLKLNSVITQLIIIIIIIIIMRLGCLAPTAYFSNYKTLIITLFCYNTDLLWTPNISVIMRFQCIYLHSASVQNNDNQYLCRIIIWISSSLVGSVGIVY